MREVRYQDWEDWLADARQLLARGYTRRGQWSLAQALGHVGNFLRYQLDGYPPMPIPVRVAMFAIRNLLGRSIKEKMLSGGTMKPGGATLTASVPAEAGDDAQAIETLEELIRRWERTAPERSMSPFLGPLSRAESKRIHLVHAAHHMKFLEPK